MINCLEKCKKIYEHFGNSHQIKKRIEEELELNIEVAKYNLFMFELKEYGECTRYTLENLITELITEIADVIVLYMQFNNNCNWEDVCNYIIYKHRCLKHFIKEYEGLIKEEIIFKIDRTLKEIEGN